MSELKELPEELDGSVLSTDLKVRICALVESLVKSDRGRAGDDLEHFLARANELVTRKRAMEGTKQDTRYLVVEVLFSRLRQAMRALLASGDVADETRAAKWVIGSLFSITSLSDFAAAIDQAIIETGAPRDFTFAGRTDFIRLEDVLQMLSGNAHAGVLSVERDDNRLDIYINAGHISFLDPHHMIRRVLPSDEPMGYREISDQDLRAVERRRAEDGTPTFLALDELGVFGDDLRKVMASLGREVLYDFMREQGNCMFFYRRLDQAPEFVLHYDLRMGVTPTLLEGNRQLDDWRSMCKVFPDPDAPVQPQPDMYVRIGELNLGVHEIKLLNHVNGSNSPRKLVRLVGMPLYAIYQHLVSLAREDVVITPGGLSGADDDMSVSLEESMRAAFECLDANDDDAEVNSALERVLGVDEEDENLRTGFLDAVKDFSETDED